MFVKKCVFRFRDFNVQHVPKVSRWINCKLFEISKWQTNKEKMILKRDVTHQAIDDVVAAVCVIILYTRSTHFHMCVQCTAKACVQKRISEKQKQQRFPCGKRTRLDIFSCFSFLLYFEILFWHYFSLLALFFSFSSHFSLLIFTYLYLLGKWGTKKEENKWWLKREKETKKENCKIKSTAIDRICHIKRKLICWFTFECCTIFSLAFDFYAHFLCSMCVLSISLVPAFLYPSF